MRQEEPYVVFEYLYRDAGNYKAFGEIWLTGSLSEKERIEFVDSLESDEFFIAEQVGVPPIYEELWRISGGRNQDDHAWHAFADFRDELDLSSELAIWGKASDLLAAMAKAKGKWEPQLSSNFDQ